MIKKDKPLISINDNEKYDHIIFVLDHIENFIRSALLKDRSDTPREILVGDPALNDDIENIHYQKKPDEVRNMVNNYFFDLLGDSTDTNVIQSKIMDTAKLIFRFIEEKFQEKNTNLTKIDFKKHGKILNKIINEWFKKNTNVSKELSRNKNKENIIKWHVSEEIRQSFFEARGNIEQRKQILFDNRAVIREAVELTSAKDVADYFNLKPKILTDFFQKMPSERWNINKIEISEEMLTQIIQMVEKDVPLKVALKTISQKNNLNISASVFWGKMKKFNPRYTIEWYREKRDAYQKKLNKIAFDIIGEENIEYLRKLPKFNIKEIGPYLDLIAKALKQTNNITVSQLINKETDSLWHFFHAYKPGWWEANMNKKIK